MLQVSQLAGFGGSVFDVRAPVVAATNSDGADDTTGLNADLPASISAGDLLIMIAQIGRSSVVPTIATPSGWEQLDQYAGTGNLRKVAVFYKAASGSEGASVALSADSTGEWATASFRITGWTSGRIAIGTKVTGTSTSADPPAVTTGWGKATLAIAIASHLGYGSQATSPSGYTTGPSGGTGAGGTPNRVNTAYKTNSDSDSADPGAFTLYAFVSWAANTLILG